MLMAGLVSRQGNWSDAPSAAAMALAGQQ